MELVVRNLRVRCNFVAARFAYRLTTPQIVTGCERCTRRRIHWPIEREHPVSAMRFDRNPLPNRFAVRRTLAGTGQCRAKAGRFPRQTFAVRDHYATPVPRAE